MYARSYGPSNNKHVITLDYDLFRFRAVMQIQLSMAALLYTDVILVWETQRQRKTSYWPSFFDVKLPIPER